jgi:hypothetical protein
MSISMNIVERGGIWRGCMPASESSLQDLRKGAPAGLPDTYFMLLRFSHGGEGDLGIEPGWFCPWPAEEVLKLNLDYEIADNMPGLFGFGSNGAGELIAFDLRQGPPWQVVMAPFIGMEPATVIRLATDFDEFLRWVGVPIRADDM